MINFEFKKIKPKKFLVYDGMSSGAIKILLKKKNYNIYYNRYEKINFWIFLKTIISFDLKNIRENYKINYIKKASPKVIITFIDNNPSFYYLKKKFPKIKTISIQNGYRTIDDFKRLKKFKQMETDFFCVFNKPLAKKYSQYIRSKYLITGSIKCNLIKKKKLRKKNEILFISQHNKNDLWPIAEKKMIKLLIKIKKKFGLNFKIVLKKNLNKQLLEIFPNLGNNIIMKKNDLSSYKHVQNYKLVLFISSTLGHEALALGANTLAIPMGCDDARWSQKTGLNIKPNKFGYPKKLPEEGFCWMNKFNEKNAIKKIIFLFRNYKINKKKYIFINKDIMAYDYQNKKIKELLRKI